MLVKLKNVLKRNKFVYRLLYYLNQKFLHLLANFIPDIIYVKWQYKIIFKKRLDLDNPVTFNEKIQWLKLNYKENLLMICSDKYKVRNFIKNQLGDQISLTKLYGVYDNVDDIVLNNLPDSFVMKTTHSSGQYFICKDKSKIDWDHIFKLFKIYVSSSHYYIGREFAYKNIAPRIICEEYLKVGETSPKDYKIYCFNGKPMFVNVYFNRFSDPRSNLYDLNWNLLPVRWEYPNFLGDFSKPKCFNKLYSIATQLSQKFIFVRVDLYNVNEEIYFSELTFYPCNGVDKFNPDKFDYILGSYLKLPV